MIKQEFNGKTLDEALAAAARALGTDVTLLSYNILPQSSGGLFSKLFQRGVRLEAWVDSKNDVQAAAREAVRQAMAGADRPQPRERTHQDKGKPPRHEKQDHSRSTKSKVPLTDLPIQRGQRAGGSQQRNFEQPREPRPAHKNERQYESSASHGGEAQDERQMRPRIPLNSEASKALLIELAEKFAKGFDPNTEPQPQLEFIAEDEVIVTVNSPQLEELLVRSDRLSCAYEHLFKRIAQKRIADVGGRVALNAGTASQQRENKLRDVALEVAAKVKENGKTITLSSKSSQERRVIHLALEHMEGIATKSVGIGENRKLIVYSTLRPQRGSSDGRPRNNRPRQNMDRGQLQVSTANDHSGAADPRSMNQNPRRSRRRGRKGYQRPGNSDITSENQSQKHDDEGPTINSEG